MSTTTITVTGNTLTLSGSVYYDEVVLKGESTVNFDFTNVDTNKNSILRYRVNYGDGSDTVINSYSVGFDHATQPITYYFALYGTYSPLLIQSHTYEPPTSDSYFKSLTAQFCIELADNSILNLYFPIRIAQPSFYTEMGNINIGSTQLLSISTNDVFCVLHDKTGDVTNIVLS